MGFSTLETLVTKVERELSQIAGPQVQLYSQEILEQMINSSFMHLHKKEFWPHHRQRLTRVINGSTGQVTVDITGITDYDDIQYVMVEGSSRPLPVLPAEFNTIGMAGADARYIEMNSVAGKLFTIYPLTSVNTILIVGRTTYDDFISTDTVPFDALALIHFTCWQYYVNDQAEGQASKHLQLFQDRYKSIHNAAFNNPIQLDNDSDMIPSGWTQRP